MAGNKNSGKKKGSTSFIAIELSRIQELIQPNTEVVVSRKWAEALGLTGGRDLKMRQNTADSMAKPLPTEEKTMDTINF
jgi:hypothetical protein